jgi:hypothetical protein
MLAALAKQCLGRRIGVLLQLGGMVGPILKPLEPRRNFFLFRELSPWS